MLRDVAGQQVWVIEEGEGDPRLFIHCSLGQSESLFALAKALPPARDIFFDLPGHGRSAAWSGSDYQTDAFEIAAALLQSPAHIIGHSFGATVALRLAVERPDLVSRLTLIEPVMFAAAAGTPAHAAYTIAFEPFVDAWRKGDREAAAATFLAMWGAGPDWDDLRPRMRESLTVQIHLIPAVGDAIEDDTHNILGRLDRVNCPVDLVEGDASQPIISAILDALAARLPHAKRHVIAGAGHMVPVTHPALVALALESV